MEKEKVRVGPVPYLGSRVIPHTEEDADDQKAAPFHLQRSVAQALPAVGMEHTEPPWQQGKWAGDAWKAPPTFSAGCSKFCEECTGEQGHYNYGEVIQRTEILGCLIFDSG